MKRMMLFAAGVFCSSALFVPAEQKPLATRVEHFFVAAEEAQSLFTFFKDTFQLPEVWPFYQHGTFASGGLSLGNVVLEFASFPRKDKKPLKTEFQGIALEPMADANATALELAKRNIPHSDARTYASQVPGRQVRAEWSSVGIADIPPKNADIFFCDYKDREGVAQGRKTASEELAKRMGGPLGIFGAAEITVGVRDLEEARSKWSALLAPSPQISEDAFVFTTGPRIRLVRAETPGILGIVLTVRSLDQAEKFLKERQLLAKDGAGRISISPAPIDGLAVALVERAPSRAALLNDNNQPGAAKSETLYSESPAAWYEVASNAAQISSDGKWIAYHSHRSRMPVPSYSAEGSTDDLYLRRASGGPADEIRLTDFGWEDGVADWSPDSRRLVFDSYDRGGARRAFPNPGS